MGSPPPVPIPERPTHSSRRGACGSPRSHTLYCQCLGAPHDRRRPAPVREPATTQACASCSFFLQVFPPHDSSRKKRTSPPPIFWRSSPPRTPPNSAAFDDTLVNAVLRRQPNR